MKKEREEECERERVCVCVCARDDPGRWIQVLMLTHNCTKIAIKYQICLRALLIFDYDICPRTCS